MPNHERNHFSNIESIDMKTQKLNVNVDLFGQETPVEVELFQVNKLQ